MIKRARSKGPKVLGYASVEGARKDTSHVRQMLKEAECTAVYVDVSPKKLRPRQRTQRRTLLARLHPGDTVVVADWSTATSSLADARSLRQRLTKLGAHLTVLQETRRTKPGRKPRPVNTAIKAGSKVVSPKTSTGERSAPRNHNRKGPKPKVDLAELKGIHRTATSRNDIRLAAAKHSVSERYLTVRLRELDRAAATRPKSPRRIAGERLAWAKAKLAEGMLPRLVAERLGVTAQILKVQLELDIA